MGESTAMKVIMVVMLLAVLAALGSAGLFMLRRRTGEDPQARDQRMARALAWRIGLSIALFLLIMLGWALGWVRPGGLPTGI